MEVRFRTRIPDYEGGFTLKARFVDVDPYSTMAELGQDISERITKILQLERQGRRFGVWGFILRSGRYEDKEFGITGQGSRVASSTPVKELVMNIRDPLEIEIRGTVINADALVPGEYNEIERHRQRRRTKVEKPREEQGREDLTKASSQGGSTHNKPPGDLPPYTPSPGRSRTDDPGGYDVSYGLGDWDDLFNLGEKIRRPLNCEMCKSKIGVLSCKQRKNVAYCGVSCYLASQKKD